MFELIILLSRFLFLAYILFFLYNSLKIAVNNDFQDTGRFLLNQRLTIVFFHLTALLILAYIPERFKFDSNILTRGFICLIYLIFANNILNKIYKSSPLIWNCIFFLIDIGYITLERLNPDLAQKQLLWYIAGSAITALIPIVFHFMPRLDKLRKLYLLAGIAMLGATLLFGTIEGGARNWINIGIFSFQPSEAVKILFIFYIASTFSKKPKPKELILPTAMSAIVVLCLVFQTDLGSALIFFMLFMVMLYLSTGSGLLFFSGLLSACAASAAAYKLFAHVRTRVLVWINPWNDIESGGYQIAQSLFAIGTAGLFGSGLTNGYSKYIPVVEKDFIFSAICEEFGALFGILLLIIFMLIIFRFMNTALNLRNRFLALLAAGLTSLIFFQTFLIIGGVIKFLPLTGVTLPFISYGGSSVITSFVVIGILQWTARSIHIDTENPTREAKHEKLYN